jgi:mono/diheme cytochrome c family protein
MMQADAGKAFEPNMKSMKTKLIAISALGIVITTGMAAAEAPSPAELTATRCLICHGDNQAGQQRLAPPFAMVKMHYQDLDEDAFIKAVSAWVKTPDKEKSKMPGAINRFGLMPALPYPDADVAAIAKYLYKTDFEMPGQGGKGMGRGQGGGCGENCKPEKCGTTKAGGKGCGGCGTPAPKP